MTEQKEKVAKVRSPNYPAFSLERCIENARRLLDRFGRAATPFEIAAKALDYSPKSSAGKQAMASLSYYGLIDSDGFGDSRKIKVSDLAFNIIIDKRPNSKERTMFIKDAAMRPAIFKKLKEQYPDKIPDDSSLEYELTKIYKVNTKTVKDFISTFKKTMDYAKLYISDIMPDEYKLNEETGMMEESNKEKAPEVGQGGGFIPSAKRNYGDEREKAVYSLGGDLKVRIMFSGNTSISEKSIEKLMKLLEINKEDFIEEQPNGKESN